MVGLSHTLDKALRECLGATFDANRLLGVVTDSVGSNIAGFRSGKVLGRLLRQANCVVHVLQLAVKDALRNRFLLTVRGHS